MVLDSPLAETRMEKLDKTQVLEDSGCFEDLTLQLTSGDEEEVVLDSEDEGICRNKTVWAPIQFSGGNALNSRKRRAASVDKQCGVGKKGCERTDEQKDLNRKSAKLNYVDSQEPGQSSQDNALEFVGHFLSINRKDLSPGIGVMTTVRDKFPPVSGAKGPQTLVKRLKSRTPISKTGIFEWADGDQHVKDDVISKRMEASFQSETRGQKALQAEETCGIKRVCKINLTNNSVKESNEDLPAESSEQQLNTGGINRETLEMYDVGFNTQIAAEAMEALSYGPSAGRVAFDIFQGSSNATENSPKSVIMGQANPEHNLIQKSLGGIARKSKQGQLSARKNGKNSSNQKLDPCDSELATMTRVKGGKSLITGQCGQRNANVSSERRPPRLIVQRQIDGTVGRNNDSENYMNSSISVECISLGKEQAETRQSLAGGTSTRTNNQSDNPAQRTEDGILRYRRKRSRLAADPTRIVSAGGRWSELHYNSSAESRNSKLGEKEQTYQEVTATTSCLKMDILSHPKRKRTLRKMQSRSNGINNIYASLATVNGSLKTTEGNDRTTCYNRDMKKNFNIC
ncbi:hypothetical protein Ddye_016796 [Dipteronia dyeriana]|uniref:Uncharacterized protein n=1 Tax=Dipteronia dyeriana TaxID=168575 RepID=A0AAD9X0N4_9ROSI|nr:hypothetical protein Ddye_016796 [Dipteronia dyeriana]